MRTGDREGNQRFRDRESDYGRRDYRGDEGRFDDRNDVDSGRYRADDRGWNRQEGSRDESEFDRNRGGRQDYDSRQNQSGRAGESYGRGDRDRDPLDYYGSFVSGRYLPNSGDSEDRSRSRGSWSDQSNRGSSRGFDQGRSFDQGNRGFDQGWRGYDQGSRSFDQGARSADQGWRGSDLGGQRSFGPHSGKGPKGYQRSDDRIREDVSDALSEHGDVDASDIEVKVSNGEVTLTGSVDSRDAKRRAEEALDHISGVNQVHNQLRVSRGENGQGMGQGTTYAPNTGGPNQPARSGSSGQTGQSGQTGKGDRATNQARNTADS